MGYECPVCEIPQADGGHLANHMAFTALVHEGDHEVWLDEAVPEWSEMGEDELAEVLIERAEETEFPQVFEDTTAGHEHHDHDHSHQRIGSQPAALDGDAQAVLDEARRLTEERLNHDEE